MARVLLVEDELDCARPIELMLQKRSHEVQVVSNGEAALFAVLHGKTPDIIILDMQMPVMDGLQFLDNLRSFARFASLPVIVTSALAPWETRDLAPYKVSRIFTKGAIDFGALAGAIESLTEPVPQQPTGTG